MTYCEKCGGFGAHGPASRSDGMWSGTNCDACGGSGREVDRRRRLLDQDEQRRRDAVWIIS